MKKFVTALCLAVCILVTTTVYAFAASGTVNYRYEKNHVLLVPLDVVTSVGTTVKLNASFNYTSSDTQSRSYTNEEYFMTVTSINAPSVTSELSFSMGILEVYPHNASAKKCTKSYTPSVLLPSGVLYHNEIGSNTKLNILKSGNSYAQLGYTIGGNVNVPVSGVAKFNNLGTATGTVTVQTNSAIVEDTPSTLGHNAITDSDYSIVILKEKIQRSQSDYEQFVADKYRGILGEANSRNILATDAEVNSYIQQLILFYESDENRDIINDICAEAGITYEKLLQREFEGYRALLTEEKLFNVFVNENSGHILNSCTIADQVDGSDIMYQWNEYVSYLNSKYK